MTADMAWAGHRACKAGHLGHIAYHLGVAALSLPPPARGHAAARMAPARWRAAPALQPAQRPQLPGAVRSNRAAQAAQAQFHSQRSAQ